MWYVLSVKTGREASLLDVLRPLGFPAIVPQERRMVRKGGGWTTKDYTMFPGYVFINLEYNAENYYSVRGLPGVLGFLGTGQAPSPLTYLEAEWIKSLRGADDAPIEPTKVRLLADGNVEILSGVLQNFTGRPIRFDKHGRRATVEITVCGQPRQVQFSIEPVSETVS